MNKNIIKTIALLLTFGTLPAEMLHANPTTKPPVGEVAHNYEDTHGRHTVRYEAYPEGTVKKLRYIKHCNRFLAVAGTAGIIAGTTAAGLIAMIGGGIAISSGGKMDEVIAPAAVGAGIAVISGMLGTKSFIHAHKAARMLERHVTKPMFSQQSLENPALKMGTFEWFVKSKETLPIFEQIGANSNANKSL